MFDKANGIHPGFRPAYPKGIRLTGTFTPVSEAASPTRAAHLHCNSAPVTVRFSNLAGIATAADDARPSPRAAQPMGHPRATRLMCNYHS
jgi:catalase